MRDTERPLEWIASSYRDLMALPVNVRRFFGYALSLAQAGDQHDSAKVLKGFKGAGVLEIVENSVGGTYRAVYTVKFEKAVFVLHRRTEEGHGNHSRQAESGRGACKRCYEMKKRLVDGV